MTSIEFLKAEYIKRGDCLPSGVFEDAKEMHKAEIADAWEMGRFNIDDFGLGEEYYQDTFVSKGSETCKENLQVELSDEEIENQAKECVLEDLITSRDSFVLGAKWYREQLKQR